MARYRRKLIAAFLFASVAGWRIFRSGPPAPAAPARGSEPQRVRAVAPEDATGGAPLRGTVVIQLMGELGNNLFVLAYYFAVRTLARDEFGLDLVLHVRKQKRKKADRAAKDARCLRSFRDVDFDECDWYVEGKGEECEDKIQRQISILQEFSERRLDERLHMTGETPDEVRSFLRDYATILRDDAVLGLYRTTGAGWTDDEPRPFLYSLSRGDRRGGLDLGDPLINGVYGRGMLEYFAFDDETKTSSGCCSMLPEEDEQVFHYRSFVSNLRNRHLSWGGGELAPATAANVLSASLPLGTKIALVSGVASNARTAAYEDAFRNRSFDVRVISGQTGIQHFCFLAHARGGLWGTEKSTYVTWASLINPRLKNATLYGANYPASKEKAAAIVPSNTDLARIVHYPLLNLSNEDVW
ncbi:hypothetical protein ACHAWF_011559 [Thalassiosira exigua]